MKNTKTKEELNDLIKEVYYYVYDLEIEDIIHDIKGEMFTIYASKFYNGEIYKFMSSIHKREFLKLAVMALKKKGEKVIYLEPKEKSATLAYHVIYRGRKKR